MGEGEKMPHAVLKGPVDLAFLTAFKRKYTEDLTS